MEYRHKNRYKNEIVAKNYYKKRFKNLYGKFNHYLESIFLKKIIKDKMPIINAIDVACGTGRLTKILFESGVNKITGIDISEEMLDEAKKYCMNENIDIIFKKGDATKIEFDDNSFDLVISFRFLDHLPIIEKEKAIREFIRVSKRYIVITMANLNIPTRIAKNVRMFFEKKYYLGFLMNESEFLKLVNQYNVKILKRNYKLPLISMEMMYLIEKISS